MKMDHLQCCYRRQFLWISSLAIVLLEMAGCGSKPVHSSADSSAGSSVATAERPRPDDGMTADLLQHIDVARDQVVGEFRLENGALVVPSVAGAMLELPLRTPDAYQLEMVAQRTAGESSLNVGLVVGGHPVTLVLEGWTNKVSGLSLVDRLPGPENRTAYRHRVFRDNGPSHIVCTVHPEKVLVKCDERIVIDWKGNSERFSLDEATMQVRKPDKLTIGGWNSEFRITKLTLTALDGYPVISNP